MQNNTLKFENSNSRSRLLGNLLIMKRYINTVQQALAASNSKISLGLEYAEYLLWNYLEERITAVDFQDFANDYYACLLNYNVGDVDIPKEFQFKYFADSKPESYELLAIEWSAGLLMQLVSMEDGRVDFEDFEECKQIDFYGPHVMLDILKVTCIELTGIPLKSTNGTDLEKAMEQVRKTSLFQEIVMHIQNDLQTAAEAAPTEYESLRNEYKKYTIIPEKFAERLEL